MIYGVSCGKIRKTDEWLKRHFHIDHNEILCTVCDKVCKTMKNSRYTFDNNFIRKTDELLKGHKL